MSVYTVKFEYEIASVSEDQLSELMSQLVDEKQDGPLSADERQLNAFFVFEVADPEAALTEAQNLMRRAFKRADLPYNDPSHIELSLNVGDISRPIAA